MTPPHIKQFAMDLRRVLYISVMQKDYCEWLKMAKGCPSYIKQDMNNMINCINRFISDVHATSSAESWELINSDLSSEQIKDLALLLDECVNIKNVEVITDVVRNSKEVVNEGV